eukprot:SAG31_NODE_622_length_13493_cov_7.301254_10_plen_557_part_00
MLASVIAQGLMLWTVTVSADRCCREDCTRCDDPTAKPFCSASKENCEMHCNSFWCSGGGGGGDMPDNFTVAVADSVNIASPSFISFTLDLSAIRSGLSHALNTSDPSLLAISRSYNRSFLRIGGTAQDNTTYFTTSATEIPPSVLTMATWDALCDFAKVSGWRIVFGLNALAGYPRPWDSANAVELIERSMRRQCPVFGWELGVFCPTNDTVVPKLRCLRVAHLRIMLCCLGNEPDLHNKDGEYVAAPARAAAFGRLSELLRKTYGKPPGRGTMTQPWIIGPDVTKGGVEKGYLAQFLNSGGRDVVDVVTWHHYYTAGPGNPVTVSKYTDPIFLNTYISAANTAASVVKAVEDPSLQLWMGETSGAGGATEGAHMVIGKFLGVFWFADKLGAAAATGHAVVCKQQFQYQVISQRGGGVVVTPEFWLTKLWQALMGSEVLAVSGGGGKIRCYAHRRFGDHNQVAVVVINLGAEMASVPITLQANGRALHASEHQQYQLTAWPNPTDLQSNGTALNGEQLELGASPTQLIPNFIARAVPGMTVVSAGYSVTFACFTVT